VKEYYGAFQQLGCEVVAVCFEPPTVVALFLAQSPMPFPVLSDPTRATYQALGLARTSWRSILRPAVIGRYLRLMLRGWRPRSSGKADLLQLGGDFVFDGQRRLAYAHCSAEPTDRPSISRLLQVVQSTGLMTL
jgi:hypothetical protein